MMQKIWDSQHIGGDLMSAELSLQQILASLEARIAFHREREAAAARQDEVFRKQRAAHAAELEALTRNLEALKAATATAVELASRPTPANAPFLGPDPDAGRRLKLPKMVARVLEAMPAGEPFGTTAVTAEINRRYRERLRRPVPARLVSIVLRRMLDAGSLRSLREGRPHHEALYAKP
jgi:multidrug efflux pump subunit AcrA (membrane-fusion protein)